MANDYIGALAVEPEDREDSGVKGMKWGVRRDRKTLKAEAAKRASTTPAVKKPTTNPDGSETSAARYARLASQAKSGRADEMTETDLKFFNARTDALAKVNKLNETQPGWLATTTKSVVQKSAQRQMQMLSDTLADKYIGKPIADALKTKPAKPDDED